MRTVFQLLVAIAAAALICAVVPQNADPDQYYTRYGNFVGNIIVRLGLNHVNSATWFLVLIGILLLSLAACSGRLWQEALVRWRIPTAAAANQRAQGASCPVGLSRLKPEQASASAQALLHRRGYRTVPLASEAGGQLWYLHKHRLSAWGQTLAHYAVFLIALGSVMGTIHGLSLDQNVDIVEGKAYQSDKGDLPFSIAVDKFTIDRAADTGAVQNYYSQVRLLAGDKELTRGTVSVNHPLRYKGYFISQSNWGLGEAQVEITRAGKTEKLTFPLERMSCPGMDQEACVWGVPEESAKAVLADGDAVLAVGDFMADARREGKKVVRGDPEYPGNPAISLMYVSGLAQMKASGAAMHRPNHAQLDWLFVGQSLDLGDGGSVRFSGITKSTGLGIRKDVGLPLVFIGFVASVLGLALIFYFPLQRGVIALETRPQGRTALTLAFYGRAGDTTADAEALWSELAEKLDLDGGPKVAKELGDD